MQVCNNCGHSDFMFPYNYEFKSLICPDCGHVMKVEPVKRRCRCGHVYKEYTWFDPSGCSKCHRSFID